MIKCGFFDVKSIKSGTKKSDFAEADIERLADLILATDGLIRPLTIEQVGIETGTGVVRYKVIEGHLEYYAAARAREKDPRKAGMVNAFEVTADIREFAIDQIALLSKTKPKIVPSSTDNISDLNVSDLEDKLFDRLLARLTSAISELLQPLQQQLDNFTTDEWQVSATISQQLQPIQKQIDTIESKVNEHTNMLASIEKLPSTNSPDDILIKVEDKKTEPQTTVPTTTKKTEEEPKPKTSNQQSAIKSRSAEPISIPIEPKKKDLAPKKSATAKKIESGATVSKSKVKSSAFTALDPDKLVNTLNLINTLDLEKLSERIARSTSINKPELVAAIIDRRDTQPAQKFESWEAIVSAGIPKLTTIMAKKIIDKLK